MTESGASRVGPAVPISAQAVLLHARAVVLAGADGSGGVIGRIDAEVLATACGALVSEVVEAGLWIEHDVSYTIRV